MTLRRINFQAIINELVDLDYFIKQHDLNADVSRGMREFRQSEFQTFREHVRQLRDLLPGVGERPEHPVEMRSVLITLAERIEHIVGGMNLDDDAGELHVLFTEQDRAMVAASLSDFAPYSSKIKDGKAVKVVERGATIQKPDCPVHNLPMNVASTLKNTRKFKCRVAGCSETAQRTRKDA